MLLKRQILNMVLRSAVLFTLFTLAIIVVLYTEKESKIKAYLNIEQNQAIGNYHALYNKYKSIADIIFLTKVNTEEVIDIFKDAHISQGEAKDAVRKRLYENLQPTYELLKMFNIKQFHFHLPDNESFLRFHRPKKYGDNLTAIRDTVAYVNQNKKRVDGFEEGRIFNGYRFVFPLFDKSHEHLGSMEVSFGSLAFHLEYLKDYQLASNFMILKAMVDKKVFVDEHSNYMPSPFKSFYFEKSVNTNLQQRFDYLGCHESVGDMNTIESYVLNGQPYTSYNLDCNVIKTYIPVHNPINRQVVAVYVSIDRADYIVNKTSNFFASVFVVVVMMAVIFYFVFRNSLAKAELSEAVHDLSVQTIELEHARRDIELMHQLTQDSIEYASLIQHSLIPSKERFDELFADSFAIWEPKDIVGGDIYLCETIREDELLLIVADCTGHGVPGALVTMLVKAIERQLVTMMSMSKRPIHPSKLLQTFNVSLRHLLKQEQDDAISNAGFDGGILYYNKKDKVIRYAGAMTPLYLMRDGNLEIYKSDRQCIGYVDSDPDYIFEEIVHHVHEGDQYYIISDGFIDQIGGEKDLPMGRTRFTKRLHEIYEFDMEKQEESLLELLSEYQGSNSRTDDVTLVGLRI
jgi:serine phosphatase RsbU (regulator of sigma subunit)